MKNIDVSIVIVNYKTPVLLKKCVGSILQFTKGLTFEIIIVDNDSQDDSQDQLVDFIGEFDWIDSGGNIGFGRANNIGIGRAKGEVVLLLNSDVELYENSIEKSYNHYKELDKTNKVGLLGCKILYEDGRLQPSCNYWKPSLRELVESNALYLYVWKRIFKGKILHDIDKYSRLNENHEIVHLGVPFALVNRALITENMFDPSYFMYFEDTDLNERLTKSGCKHFYFHETAVYHLIGASSTGSYKRDRQIFASRLLYILKTYSKLYYKIFILLSRFNLAIDLYFDKKNEVLNRNKSWLLTYSKVVSKIENSNDSLNTYGDPVI
jgi:GT2 family glycosyltransferase